MTTCTGYYSVYPKDAALRGGGSVFAHCRNYSPAGCADMLDMESYSSCGSCRHFRQGTCGFEGDYSTESMDIMESGDRLYSDYHAGKFRQ